MILVVNNDAQGLGVLKTILTSAGFDVRRAAGGLSLERQPASSDDRDEQFEDLANRVPVAIWVMGRDERLQFYNKRAAGFVGSAMSRVLNEGWGEIVHPQDLERAQAKYSAAVAGGRGFRIECRMLRGNDEHRWVLHTGAARYVRGRFAGHIGTSVDITDLKLGYERMMTAQKRESLGTLTAGIAHDFNTLLASIFAAADLAMFALPPDSPARENLARIYRAATRASEIVKLLMSYAETTKVRI